ncbi:MAG: hypothetical protein WC600_04630 [Desulfobaccales bacterium]
MGERINRNSGFIFPTILIVCFVVIIYVMPIFNIQLDTKMTGYLLASLLLILGLFGLWLDNVSLFQQQVFKLIVWTGVFLLILTFCFSIAIDIIEKV